MRCEVVSTCVFELLPGHKWCWVSFCTYLGHLPILFGEMYFQLLYQFLIHVIWFLFWFSLLSSWSSVKILVIDLSSDRCFANIFFYSVVCFHFCWISSLLCRNWLSVVPLVNLCCVTCALGVIAKKSLPRWASGRFSPIISFRNFWG